MRKGKKAAMELPHGTSFFPAGDEAKARFRHQSLLQDYQDLLKETEAKRKQLEKAKQKKHKLLAEVRFLQRRYKSLAENPSGKIPYRMKKRSQNMRPQEMDNGQTTTKQIIQSEVSNRENKVSAKHNSSSSAGRDSSMPSTSSAGIDLNKVSSPNGEEMEFQVDWEPLGTDKSKKRTMDDDDDDGAFSSDLKLSVCRELGKGRAGKRKITWQDQVALKV